MTRWTLRLVAILALGFVPACLQQIDPNAASSGSSSSDNGGSDVAIETPPIDLPGGGTTNSACDATSQAAMSILSNDCASCHGGGSAGAAQGQPPFDYVLDVNKLLAARSESVPDPTDPSQGMRFLDPGAPEDSRIYVRIYAGEMPPAVPLGSPEIPRPNVSDMSVLYTWITNCVQGQ